MYKLANQSRCDNIGDSMTASVSQSRDSAAGQTFTMQEPYRFINSLVSRFHSSRCESGSELVVTIALAVPDSSGFSQGIQQF
jgi:hypothetical protein